MPLKVIINVDLETGESDNFLWAEKEEPPPLVRPKVKPREPRPKLPPFIPPKPDQPKPRPS